MNPDDTLNRIIEIPQLSGSVKALGGVTYAVGTHIEGMGDLNQETDVDGMKYRTERFTSGSATELADEQGTTYQVGAYESTLQPLVKTVTDSKGATYAIAENGKSVIRTNADGSTFTYARYDATTNIDLFILIGRLIKGNQNITRYEMAQMIAKAMAKTDVSAADKALIDKLAAEFSDELNTLGVRVSVCDRYTLSRRQALRTNTAKVATSPTLAKDGWTTPSRLPTMRRLSLCRCA